MSAGESSKSRVVVAHSETAIRESAVAVARVAGYEVVGVADGESARILLHSLPSPAVLVVDVALPDVLGYELCDEVQQQQLATKVILVASVYSKTAYKRRPSSLYGASDYIEQHHIVDQLADKLRHLLAAPERGPLEVARRRRLSATGEHKALKIREASEARMAFRYRNRGEAIERAKGLARLLVADLVLYCGEAIQTWRAAGAAGELPEALAADVEEGRRLYELRVPPEIASERDFFGEALQEFLASGVHAAEDETWPLQSEQEEG